MDKKSKTTRSDKIFENIEHERWNKKFQQSIIRSAMENKSNKQGRIIE